MSKSSNAEASGGQASIVSAKQSHPLDDSNKGSTLSLEGFDLELPSLDSYLEELVDFPSSPKKLKELRGDAMPLETDPAAAGCASEDEDDTSIYRAVVASNFKGVQLQKDTDDPEPRRRILTPDPADLILNDEDDDDEITQHFVVNVEINHATANQRGGRRKIPVDASLLAADTASLSSDDDADPELSLDIDLDLDLDSPDEVEDSILERLGEEAEPIAELTAAEERSELRSWRHCQIAGVDRSIDMKVIEPYKRVLSHGGYLTAGRHNAIVVFSACFLPDRSRADYHYVMDNLFFYVLVTLEQLVTEDYVLVYLHGATARSRIPTLSWLKRCYQMIDRRLRKNLKGLYLVHPTFWLKTFVVMTRPFVSSKFARKLSFVESLADLFSILPLEQASIPDRVKQLDDTLFMKAKY